MLSDHIPSATSPHHDTVSTLSVLTLNCRSLNTVKQNLLLSLLEHIQQRPDILLLQEISSTLTPSAFLTHSIRNLLKGYLTYFQGNMAIAVQRRFYGAVEIQKSFLSSRILVLRLNSSVSSRYCIVNVHGPHNTEDRDLFLAELDSIIHDNRHHRLLLGGDWNLTVSANDSIPRRRPCTPLINLIQKHNLIDPGRVLGGPDSSQFTRFDPSSSQSSRLDYFLVNNAMMNQHLSTSILVDHRDDAFTDHTPVMSTYQLLHSFPLFRPPRPLRLVVPEDPSDQAWERWETDSKRLFELCTPLMERFTTGPVSDNIRSDFQSLYKRFTVTLEQRLMCCFPQPPDPLYFFPPKQFSQTHKEYKKAKNLLQRTRSRILHGYGIPRDVASLCRSHTINPRCTNSVLRFLQRRRTMLRQRLKQISHSIREEKKQSRLDGYRKLFCTNDKRWYRCFRKFKPRSDFAESENGTCRSADYIQLNESIRVWRNIFDHHPVSDANLKQWIHECWGETPRTEWSSVMDPFTLPEILSLFLGNGNTAPGLDHITYQMMRRAHRTSIAKFLQQVFNACLHLQCVPDMWKHGVLCLIAKNDQPKADEYRPIALLSCIGKSFTKLLNIRLSAHSHSILSPYQIGFRRHHQCLDHIILLRECMHRHQKHPRKPPLYCLFVDFAKAFDSVPHSLVMQVMSHLFGHNCGNLFKASLTGSLAFVQTPNGISQGIPLRRGVRQGDTISPLSFSYCLEPLIRKLNQILSEGGATVRLGPIEVGALAFADDIVIVSTKKHILQQCADALHEWCQHSGMAINVGRTKTALLTVNGKDPAIHIGSQKVYKLRNHPYPYLGFKLNRLLANTHHLQHRMSSAASWVKDCKILSHWYMKHIDYVQRVRLVSSYVRPKLNYGCLLLSPSLKGLEKMARKERNVIYSASKSTLRIHKCTIHSFGRTGLHLLPLHHYLNKMLYTYILDLKNREHSLTFIFVQYLLHERPPNSLFLQRLAELPEPIVLPDDPTVDQFPFVVGINTPEPITEPETMALRISSQNDMEIEAERDRHTHERHSQSHTLINRHCNNDESQHFRRNIHIPAFLCNFIINARNLRLNSKFNIARMYPSTDRNCPNCHDEIDTPIHFLFCRANEMKFSSLVQSLFQKHLAHKNLPDAPTPIPFSSFHIRYGTDLYASPIMEQDKIFAAATGAYTDNMHDFCRAVNIKFDALYPAIVECTYALWRFHTRNY